MWECEAKLVFKKNRQSKVVEPLPATTHYIWQEEQRKMTKMEMKVSRDECWWTGSDNIRRSSRLHGFLVWGILCCKFFSFLHFCSPKTPRWKKRASSKTERTNTALFFPARGFKALVRFYFFLFLFLMEQRPVIFTFGKATAWVLLDLQRTNELGC